MSSLVARRESHYIEFLGDMSEHVWHSTDAKAVHVDIYQFLPTEDRSCNVLITGGMSDRRQKIPQDRLGKISHRAEIMTYCREPQPWMVRALKILAEMPWECDTFLHWWHTVPSPHGKPVTSSPSQLTSFFFVQPYREAEGFGSMTVEGDRVDFLVLVPITEHERNFIITKGQGAFMSLLNSRQFDYVIDENRRSFV